MAIKYSLSVIISGLVLLSACHSSNQIVSAFELGDSPLFTLHSSIYFNHKYERADGSVAYTNYVAPKFNPEKGDITLKIYQLLDQNCGPAIGISNPVLQEQDESQSQLWGEVDEKDDGSYPEPNCRVKSIYPEKNPYEQMTSYAFCSEKDGKTVVICISQMTDNPELAEEIFSTFRWVE